MASFSFKLPEELKKNLEDIAKDSNISMSRLVQEYMQAGLTLEKYCDKTKSEIVIHKPKGDYGGKDIIITTIRFGV